MTSMFSMSPEKSCRVAKVNSTEMLHPGRIHRGFSSFTTPEGVQYHTPGMTVSNFNGSLRLPQKRTFLGPEYYNGGCYQMFCKDAAACTGQSARLSQASPAENALFEAAFESPHEPFTGNDAPPQCSTAKCGSYSSVTGWETNGTSFRWQQ